ncbi:MAG: DUF4097 family beta strand repeat protein [Acidobacteria bacterium]|nr:DUF4097 family beta strand repeat protein [Acidobacteriota bacterium]
MRMLVTAGLVACLGAASAGCEVNLNTEGLAKTETRTFPVTGSPELTLETFDGAIEIHSWDEPSVEVSIEKRGMDQAILDAITIEAEQQGDRIVLRVKGPGRANSDGITVGMHISPSARLLVALPRSSNIQAHTEDGSIRVDDVEGKVTLRSGDGSVALDRVSGEIEVRTSDGSVRLDKVSGRLDIDTGDGSITIDGQPTVLRARTTDGTIRARIDGDARMTDAWDLSTGDGSITLALPSGFAAEVDAETRSGAVRVSHPAIVTTTTDDRDADRAERRENQRSLRTKMGEGGHALRLRTGDGTIRIES